MKQCRICKKEEKAISIDNLCIKCWVRKYAWKWSDKDIRAELKKESDK
jgi:hypothetical protein